MIASLDRTGSCLAIRSAGITQYDLDRTWSSQERSPVKAEALSHDRRIHRDWISSRTLPHGPMLFPKLRIQVADFSQQHSTIGEASRLGDQIRLFVRFRKREYNEFLSFSLTLYIKYTTTESSDGFTSTNSLPQTYTQLKELRTDVRKEKRLSAWDTERHQELQLFYYNSNPPRPYWVIRPVHLSQKHFDMNVELELPLIATSLETTL